MADEDVFHGGHEIGADGQPCKFAIGDVVRLKDGTGPAMRVTMRWRHPDELADSVNCTYKHHDADWCSTFKVDDLELVPPDDG